MKINELKRIAKENDYEYKFDQQHELTNKTNGNYIAISDDCVNRIWCRNHAFCSDEDFNMMKAAVEFAETPLENRGVEKKFYLKHKYLRSVGDSAQYLTTHNFFDFPFLAYIQFSGTTKQLFTCKDIEEIKEKFNTDLAEFEWVEVEDEDED